VHVIIVDITHIFSNVNKFKTTNPFLSSIESSEKNSIGIYMALTISQTMNCILG